MFKKFLNLHNTHQVPQLIHAHTPEVHGNLKHASYSVDNWMSVEVMIHDTIAMESVDFTDM